MSNNENAKIETLKKNFELTANGYLKVLCDKWELDEGYGYWIGDEIGGLYDFADGYVTITYDDMRFCVENDVSLEEYNSWQEYCLFCHDYKQTMPNFKSWHKGCPRISKEMREHLKKLKAEFEQACKEASESLF